MNTAGYCVRCGAGLAAGDRFCGSCGAIVRALQPIAESDLDLDKTMDSSLLGRSAAKGAEVEPDAAGPDAAENVPETTPVRAHDMSNASGEEFDSPVQAGQRTLVGSDRQDAFSPVADRQWPTSPGGYVPITSPPLSGGASGGSGRFSGAVAFAAAAVLALDFFLPPAYSTYGGTKLLWTLGFVHVDYLSLQFAGEMHNYPPVLWWMSAAIVLAAIALLASLTTFVSGGQKGAKVMVAAAVASVAAAFISAEVGNPHAGVGIGCWGALAAGVVVVIAGLGVFQGSQGASTTSGRRLSVLASLGAAAVLIAAIPVMQNSSPSYNAYTGGGSGTDSPPTTPTVPSLPAGQLINTYSFTETEAGGYTFSGSLSLGAPEVFRNGITEGNLTAGSACTINSQTDAVIPGVLTVDNTTQSFSAIGGAEFQWNSGAIGGVEIGYTDGAQCEGENSGGSSNSFGIESTDPEPDGEGATGDLFIVIPDYYSPADPNGDSSLLVNVDLQLVDLVDSTHNLDIAPQTVSGPGSSSSNGLYIPIDAAAQAAPAGETGQTFQIIRDDTPVMDSPSSSGDQVGTLEDGASISVLCTTQGDEINSDSLWDKIASPAGYVADAYVNTDAGAGIPTC